MRCQGIEPQSPAWQVIILPLNHQRRRAREFFENSALKR